MAASLIAFLLMTSSKAHQDSFVLMSGQFVLTETAARFALAAHARVARPFSRAGRRRTLGAPGSRTMTSEPATAPIPLPSLASTLGGGSDDSAWATMVLAAGPKGGSWKYSIRFPGIAGSATL